MLNIWSTTLLNYLLKNGTRYVQDLLKNDEISLQPFHAIKAQSNKRVKDENVYSDRIAAGIQVSELGELK